MYDALNVLVAGGIILKDSKKIFAKAPLMLGCCLSIGWPSFSKHQK